MIYGLAEGQTWWTYERCERYGKQKPRVEDCLCGNCGWPHHHWHNGHCDRCHAPHWIKEFSKVLAELYCRPDELQRSLRVALKLIEDGK